MFSWNWRQMTTEKLLLAALPIDRISTISNQLVLRSVGKQCYHNFQEHGNDFIKYREN
jgi:hypothetical protein